MKTPAEGCCTSEVIGSRLKQLRKDHHVTQETLAEMLSVSKDTIYNYEKGNTAIPHASIGQLCREFNVSADYFFFGIEKPLQEDQESGDSSGAALGEQVKMKIDQMDDFDKERCLKMIALLMQERPAI
ncbi:MAG: helix-turn-helix domain-containing protein [Agathobacter sp.]